MHNDRHCQEVWGGELAFPRGCGSFVDSFAETSPDIGFVSRGTVVQVVDDETGVEMCTLEGEAFFSEGSVDVHKERSHNDDPQCRWCGGLTNGKETREEEARVR